MDSIRDSAYLCPSPFDFKTGKVGYTPSQMSSWIADVLTDGKSFLRNQPAYKWIQDGMDMVNGDLDAQQIGTLSDYKTEMTNRNAKEIVAAQTNIRIIPSFSTAIQEYNHQKEILNKSFMAWQTMTFFDRRLRKGWQYATYCGTGYIGSRYDPDYWYKGHGDIVTDAYGPMDVLPVGMGTDNDLQKAYVTAIRVPMPIHKVWRLYPLMRDKIRSSRENSMSRGSVIAQSVRYASAVLKRFGPGTTREEESMPWDMVDVYYLYVDDDSVNNTGQVIPMGQPGTSWYYTVPYLGQELKVGETPGGQAITRKAMRDDCLLYPNKRLIIGNSDNCLNLDPSDQVSPFWHGKTPVAQLRADDYPWLFLGVPITRYGLNIEKNNNTMSRGMVDAVNVRLSPPRSFDRNTMSDSLVTTMNPRIPNQVVGLDMTFGGPDQIKPLLPVQFYEFPAWYIQYVQQNEQRISHQMGVADAQAMTRARQLPSGDSVEKIMESLGPLIKDQSRNMEESIRFFGELWKSNFFQFYRVKRRMQLLGPDGASQEDYDYDPGSLVPSDSAVIEMRKVGTTTQGVDVFERARWHKDNFTFQITPYSLHELNSMTRKLFHLQLKKSGFPLDPWTEAELFDVKNFGPLPQYEDPVTGEIRTADTIIERWVCWMEMQAHMQQALQGGGGGAGGAGGKKQVGRPSTGAQPPTLEQKSGDGGTRSTVRESKR